MGEFVDFADDHQRLRANGGGGGDDSSSTEPDGSLQYLPPPPPPPPPQTPDTGAAAASTRRSQSRPTGRRRGRQPTLQAGAKCRVCELAASGNNFGVATCESCKTFFRRNAKRENSQLRCLHQNSCNIVKEYRRSCTSCRLRKCFAVGMKKDLILPEDKLRSRARPTFKKPRYRWCRLPADVDVAQLMAALAASGADAASVAAAAISVKQEASLCSYSDDASRTDMIDADDMAAEDVEEDEEEEDEEIDDAATPAAAAAGDSSAVSAAAAAAAAVVAPCSSGARSLDPRWQAEGKHFETTPTYHQLCLCVTDYQLPYDQQCASTLSSKLFNLEDGFSTLENSVRKMIRLIPSMPLLGDMDKNLLGKLVKHRVFGAIQIISVLSYDFERDAWVVLLENGQGMEEAVLHTKEAITGTFMSLTSKRWMDDRSLYSTADVERIYETLTDYYRDVLRLFGGHRKVAALILLVVYLLEDDTALELTDAEKSQVRHTQSQYLSHLDGLCGVCVSGSRGGGVGGDNGVDSAIQLSKRALLSLLRIRWLDVRYSDGSKILQVARVPPLMQELAAT